MIPYFFYFANFIDLLQTFFLLGLPYFFDKPSLFGGAEESSYGPNFFLNK